MPTKSEIFVIETLSPTDEMRNLFEGFIIQDVLRRAQKQTKYVYVQDRQEFEVALAAFDSSGCRYLHLSCHGSPTSIDLTRGSLAIDELADILHPHLIDRRLFVSSCSLSRAPLANRLFQDQSPYSVLGTAAFLPWADAAAFWPALYLALFKRDMNEIHDDELGDIANALANIFRLEINYYVRDPGSEKRFRSQCFPDHHSFSQYFYANCE